MRAHCDDRGLRLGWATEYVACALSNGTVKCWGSNSNGNLGDNTLLDRATPVTVAGLPTPVVQLSAGSSHVCAVQYVGKVDDEAAKLVAGQRLDGGGRFCGDLTVSGCRLFG